MVSLGSCAFIPMLCLFKSLLEVSRCFYIFKKVNYIIMCAEELITDLVLSGFYLEKSVLFALVKNQAPPLAWTLWQSDEDVKQHIFFVCCGFPWGVGCSELAQY